MRVIEGVEYPYGVAFNSRGEMYVTEEDRGQVAVFDSSGKRTSTIGSRGHHVALHAIDSNDSIYVTSEHKLRRNGEFVEWQCGNQTRRVQ